MKKAKKKKKNHNLTRETRPLQANPKMFKESLKHMGVKQEFLREIKCAIYYIIVTPTTEKNRMR